MVHAVTEMIRLLQRNKLCEASAAQRLLTRVEEAAIHHRDGSADVIGCLGGKIEGRADMLVRIERSPKLEQAHPSISSGWAHRAAGMREDTFSFRTALVATGSVSWGNPPSNKTRDATCKTHIGHGPARSQNVDVHPLGAPLVRQSAGHTQKRMFAGGVGNGCGAAGDGPQ
jgi:hypothetical protein